MDDNTDSKEEEKITIVHEYDGAALVRILGVPDWSRSGREMYYQRLITKDGERVLPGFHWEKYANKLQEEFGASPSDDGPVIPLSVVLAGRQAVTAYLYVTYRPSRLGVADLLDVTSETVSRYLRKARNERI